MGNSLERFRKEKVLSQSEVAYLINKDATYISKIENGRIKDINLSLAYRLAKIYDVAIEDLYFAIFQ
ncbi:helix-turn-helix transcriptional regulator [Clostridium perfringens]|nr:helix-turn-helix transcriptional regulator [Clostridium perfringens]